MASGQKGIQLKNVLITGSSGLIGSEVAVYFHNQNFRVHGLDNNQRAIFFGPQGDTRWRQGRHLASLKRNGRRLADLQGLGLAHLKD